ncbi:hypothetical protein SAMN04487950_1153 [Halogranum rubrum]|uniref:DUF7979 domain-containing protein n=1 Tax=Halogranum rubrum TaxID=553466 RepID=A0A1I4CHF5_9EURY|nr:hypothetical protein [Halogranum rubrum]SFK80020.1 hypothetical protein SAMN04487950_1153 [Halogranum rubrum]
MSQSVAPLERSLSRVDRVHPSARVRHFDQLSESAQEYVIAWASDDAVPNVLPEDLRADDVVVFTDYLHVA